MVAIGLQVIGGVFQMFVYAQQPAEERSMGLILMIALILMGLVGLAIAMAMARKAAVPEAARIAPGAGLAAGPTVPPKKSMAALAGMLAAVVIGGLHVAPTVDLVTVGDYRRRGRVHCLSNLHLLGSMLRNFETDNRGHLPVSFDVDLQRKYGITGGTVSRCPRSNREDDYIYLLDHARATGVAIPALISPNAGTPEANISGVRMSSGGMMVIWENEPRHMGRRNALFADGHVESLNQDEFEQNLRKSLEIIRVMGPKNGTGPNE